MTFGSVDYNRIELCPLCHDWMFGKVLSNERVLRIFLEELLNIQIGRIDIISAQKTEDAGPYFRGMRADIYAKDTDKFLFNVEMQNSNEGNLEYRIRFQQAVMDSQSLAKGDSVEDLRKSYIIFVCNFDYYKQGSAVYERTSYIGNPPLVYDDGSHILVLNSKYVHANASDAILEFLSNLNRSMKFVEGRTRLMLEIRDVFEDMRTNPALMKEYLLYGSYFRAEMKDMREKDILNAANYVEPDVLAKCFNLSLSDAQSYVARARATNKMKNDSAIYPVSFGK